MLRNMQMSLDLKKLLYVRYLSHANYRTGVYHACFVTSSICMDGTKLVLRAAAFNKHHLSVRVLPHQANSYVVGIAVSLGKMHFSARSHEFLLPPRQYRNLVFLCSEWVENFPHLGADHDISIYCRSFSSSPAGEVVQGSTKHRSNPGKTRANPLDHADYTGPSPAT